MYPLWMREQTDMQIEKKTEMFWPAILLKLFHFNIYINIIFISFITTILSYFNFNFLCFLNKSKTQTTKVCRVCVCVCVWVCVCVYVCVWVFEGCTQLFSSDMLSCFLSEESVHTMFIRERKIIANSS